MAVTKKKRRGRQEHINFCLPPEWLREVEALQETLTAQGHDVRQADVFRKVMRAGLDALRVKYGSHAA